MNPTTNATTHESSGAVERSSSTQGKGRWLRIVMAGVGIYALGVVATGIYWSLQPDAFDVRDAALARVGGDESRLGPGVVTVATIGEMARTLLDKSGGYLYNDVSLPSLYLDNMPSWEYGAVKEVRDALHALRNDFSRSQTQSIEHIELRNADEFMNYHVDSWFLPSTESEFRKGLRSMDRYLDDLIAGDDASAAFFVRADNLAAYLAVVEKRLGSFAQRLSASVGDRELTAALVSESEPELDPGGQATDLSRTATPWMEIDNVFHEARGYSWALLHTFKALQIEFDHVLKDKNAEVSMAQMVLDLEEATKRMWSPMVLNGHGFGYVANHSLVLASYLSRANAAVIDLRLLLQQG